MKPGAFVCVFIATVIAMSAASLGAAEADTSMRAWISDVSLSKVPDKGLVEISLPNEVFAKSRRDLADLLLADDTGRIIPYVLRLDKPKRAASVSYLPDKLYNRSFVSRKSSSVTLDFGKAVMKSRIDINTPGKNFRRAVTIEGSGDGKSWQVLRKAAWLFSVAGEYKKNRIKLPQNDFRYLRITVFNAPDDPDRVKIGKIVALYIKDTPAKTVPVEAVSTDVSRKRKKKLTEIQIDLGYKNLPLHKLELSFADSDENFLRRVKVRGRNYKVRTITEHLEDSGHRKRRVTEPWHFVTTSTIYRFAGGKNTDSRLTVRLPVDGRYRYLLVEIFNGDNEPLKFTEARAHRLRHFLEFEPKGKSPWRLYFGYPDAKMPQYDLASFVSRLRADSLTQASLEQAAANPEVSDKRLLPWSERHRGLLWAAIIIVMLILGSLVIRLMAQGPQDKRNNSR